MRILLIEDELLIQRSLKKFLEQKGVHVTAVSSGKQAIDSILQNDFDRIVCDLMLQDITGFDIIEEVKQKYSPQEISDIFVIMTAYSSDQVLKKASQYGCPILNKPFELKSAMNLILEEPGNA